ATRGTRAAPIDGWINDPLALRGRLDHRLGYWLPHGIRERVPTILTPIPPVRGAVAERRSLPTVFPTTLAVPGSMERAPARPVQKPESAPLKNLRWRVR